MLSPEFGQVEARVDLPARVVRHIQESRADQAPGIFAKIRETALRPDRVWPNPTRPDDPWARPWLVKEDGRGTATIVEVQRTVTASTW